MTNRDSSQNGGFVPFPTLVDDDAGPSGQSGLLGGLFGRFFRNGSSSEAILPESIADLTVDTESNSDVVPEMAPPVTQRSQESPDGDTNSLNSESSQRKLSQRLSNLFKGNANPQLVDYDRSDFRRYWMPDSTVKECYECHEKFSAFKRKHHCRLCGQIFCSKCSRHSINGVLLGYVGLLRVCGYCQRNVDAYLSSNSPKIRRSEGVKESDTQSNTGSLVSTVSNGPIQFSNDSSLLYADSHLHHSISGAQITPVSSDVSVPGADPSHLSIQQLHDYQQFMRETDPTAPKPIPTEATANEPEWVRNIASSNGVRQIDSFKSVECPAYEIQPCIDPTTTTVKPKPAITETLQLGTGDLNELFERKLEQMLDFLFIREQIPRETWYDVLWPLSKEIAATVKVDILNRGTNESMNILKYVHIKKLLVSVPHPDYEVIDGVACSKTLAHSDMPKHVDNASVMVLNGGIAYEREPLKHSSIEPIIEQEQEFLKNHVERITSRRVTLLLVEDSVAKLASDMLMASHVALIPNVKRSVLERVARSTKATLTSLMDAQMHPAVVGFCPQFKERVITLKNGIRKSLLIFDDCQGELGVSVLLRASSRRELCAAKRILKFLVLQRYSSKLEIDFLNMFQSKPRAPGDPVNCDICIDNAGDLLEQPNEFTTELQKSVLTNSPLIHYAPPYLETPVGRTCYLVDFFKKPTTHYFTAKDYEARRDSDMELEHTLNRMEEALKAAKDKVESVKWSLLQKKNVTEVNPNDMIRFRARGGLLFNAKKDQKQAMVEKMKREIAELQSRYSEKYEKFKGTNNDVLNPYSHQRIAFLYSSFSKRTVNNPCSGPWLVVWPYYGAQDRPLGGFLANFCLNETYKCKMCSKSMIDHQRKFVHKYARIEITTQMHVKPASTSDENGTGLPPSVAGDTGDGILAWRRCPSCKSNSAVVPLPPPVWHMSFAKFIDYLANGIFCTSPLPDISDSACETCGHCTFHEQQHYFARRNYTTCFKVLPVNPLHVVFSPVQCSIVPATIKCESVVAKRMEAISLAETIFSEAKAFLVENEATLSAADVFDEVVEFINNNRKKFNDVLTSFSVGEKFTDLDTITSDDPDYRAAMDAFCHCRQFLFNFIELWNSAKTAEDLVTLATRTSRSRASTTGEESLLGGSDDLIFRAPSGSFRSTGSTSTVNVTSALRELPPTRINIPLPKNYHWELPFGDTGPAVIVKDLLDQKGNSHPDIGSVIAYALSCTQYSQKLSNLRKQWCDEGKPLTLRNIGIEGGSGLHSPPQDTNANIEIEFEDSKAHYYVKAYFAEHFDLLRRVICVEGEDFFLRSLSTSGSWHPEGGKSGASFFRTSDERFIFKQLSSVELDCFRKCAPNYFDYMYTAVTEKKLTALGKIFGVYQVAYRNKEDNQEFKMDLLIMEFLFYKKNVKKLWDLKGSLRNRYASPKSSAPVLLDENLVQDLWGNQIYIHTHSKAALNQAMANDSRFLTSLDIMDYSLLAGIIEETNEVVIGIVDYMRTFTLDKKLESLVKTALPTPHLPTVVSPTAYCRRFCEAIDMYFPFAPDQWTELNSDF
uniref:1-phosphatidylinositol-3-phosphate 5-kinase n=1 Tax=Panagrellus redivivus TaxID=6233 RepID=A0A7E4VY87_PANRE